MATPEGRERMRERDKTRYSRATASPEALERMRARDRARYARAHGKPKPTITCEDGQDSVEPTCAMCGKPTGFYLGRPLRFCPRPGGEKRSPCQVRYSNRVRTELVQNNPELRAERTRRQRELDAANPEKRRARSRKAKETLRNNPRRWAAKLAAAREARALRRAQHAGRRPTKVVLKPSSETPTGSVLLTSSFRAPGRELLAEIYAAVPARLPPALRMEIISETAVLVLEGADLRTAVAQATKGARRDENRLRYARPIEDCFWLADDSSFSMGAH